MTNLSSSEIGNGSGAKNVVIENASPCDAIRPMSVTPDRSRADGVTVTEAMALERVEGAMFPPEGIPIWARGFDVVAYVDGSMLALEESTYAPGCAGVVERNSSERPSTVSSNSHSEGAPAFRIHTENESNGIAARDSSRNEAEVLVMTCSRSREQQRQSA